MGPELVKAVVAKVVEGDQPEQVLEAAVEKRIALHVKEHVTVVGLRQPREATAGLSGQDLDLAFAGSPLVRLQAGLRRQPDDGVRLHAVHPGSGRQQPERSDVVDAGFSQCGNLSAPHACDDGEVVGGIPFVVAAIRPTAEGAVSARVTGRRRRRRVDERLEAAAGEAEVVQHRRCAEGGDLPRSENDVHLRRHDALHRGKHLGIDAQLEDVLGLGRPCQFGVGDVVGVGAERGNCVVATQEEVGIAVPAAYQEGALVHDVVPFLHRAASRLGAFLKGAARGDFIDGAAFVLEPAKVGELVLDALLLQQHGVLVVGREGRGRHQVPDVQD